jgi:hypothetical protein
MERLRFSPGQDTSDPDTRMLSDSDLQKAAEEGKKQSA